MKRNLIIVAGLSLILAAACSKTKTEVIVIDNNSAAEAWVNNQNLPVPIQFADAKMNVDTKAITSGELTSLGELDLGVFALAVTGDGTTESPKTPAWADNDAATTLLKNYKVVTTADGGLSFPGQYYPVGSEKAFSFYGYYPYSEAASTVTSGTSETYSAQFDLGYLDVLHAVCHAVTGSAGIGYNAKYIRYVKQQGWTNRLPELSFNHVLTSLQIQAQVTGETSDVRIHSVVLKNVPTKGSLCIVDNNTTLDSNNTGKITAVDGQTGDITLTDGTDTDFSDVELAIKSSENYTTLSQFLVIPATSYTFEVTYQMYDTNASQLVGEQRTLTASVSKANEFAAGTRHAIRLSIDPANITATASLVPWVDYNGSQDAIIDYGD